MTETRKRCRAGSTCQPRTLGEAAYCLIHHSDLEAPRLAELIGVRHGYLLDAANPDREDAQLQARLLMPLTIATQNFVVLQYLAQAVNGVFFPLPKLADDAPDALFGYVGDAAEQFGSVLRDLAGVARGSTDVALAQSVVKRCDGAIAALAKVKLVMDRRGGLREVS